MPSSQSTETATRHSPELLSEEEVRKLHGYWRAANYLTVGQIYLKDNPLLERPLGADDIKPRLLDTGVPLRDSTLSTPI